MPRFDFRTGTHKPRAWAGVRIVDADTGASLQEAHPYIFLVDEEKGELGYYRTIDRNGDGQLTLVSPLVEVVERRPVRILPPADPPRASLQLQATRAARQGAVIIRDPAATVPDP
jgi:hypothetical protein